MVVFYQHAVGEVGAVVASAAADDRVFLRQAQTGQRFARVEDDGRGVRYARDVRGGRGRGAGQRLQQVQRAALCAEDSGERPAERAHFVARRNRVAVFFAPDDRDRRVNLAENLVHPETPREDGGVAADDDRVAVAAVVGQRGGDVTAPQILGQCRARVFDNGAPQRFGAVAAA